MSNWIPVTEKLPDDEECVLIVTEDGEVWTGFLDAEQWRYVSADPVGLAVTHWMRFPPPPSAADAHAVERYEIMQTGSD
ncbi:MAG: DUF551 domain-containing protein [Gammaproteobacteria bacterium]|nr:DUF551 domain-containing protein [Gammaproteobacteria bacterium]MBU1731001.1 DUF551 domain-containing protein [Gammaproteobacteria bacterium]MBU1893661.1 DUF551 domain-containing protein [Gammaproteobacteria bacterium]